MTTQQETPASSVAEVSHPAGGSPVGVASFTIPPKDVPPSTIGAYRSEDHRYWSNGIGPVPSVTTILDMLDKPAVTTWKAKETARVCIREWMTLSDILEKQGEEEAIKWAANKADEARDKAAALGSSIHLLADMEGIRAVDPLRASEKPVEGWNVSAEEMPYLEAFRGFLARYGASAIVSSEKMVWSLSGYAGTFDLLMLLPHEEERTAIPGESLPPADDLWLIDVKTGKGFYPEMGLQLAAYRWADYIILENDPNLYPMPHIHRTGILHLRPDLYPDTGWRLIEYPTAEVDYVAFLSTLNTYSWKKLNRFTKSRLTGRRQKEWKELQT